MKKRELNLKPDYNLKLQQMQKKEIKKKKTFSSTKMSSHMFASST